MAYESQFYGREMDPRGSGGGYYESRSAGPFRGGRNDLDSRGRGGYYDEFGGRDQRPEPVYGVLESDLRDSIHYQNPRLGGYNDGGGRYQR